MASEGIVVQTKMYPARNNATFEGLFWFRWALLRTRASITSRLTTQFHGDQSTGDGSVSEMDPCRPLSHISHPEGLQAADLRDPPTPRIVKRQGPRVHAHQDRATLPHDVVDPRWSPVDSIAQKEIPPADWDAAESLAPSCVGQFEEVALQVGEIDDIVDPPIRAFGPWFLDCRGVDGPDSVTRGGDRRRSPVPQLLCQPPQPLFGGLEPLEYSDR